MASEVEIYSLIVLIVDLVVKSLDEAAELLANAKFPVIILRRRSDG